MLLAACHDDGGWKKIDDLSTISELRSGAGNLLWVEADIANLEEADVEVIAEEFDLHPLAVEDATAPRQRPKVENYSNHLFATLHQLDEEDGQLEPVQLAFFIGRRYVLTIHHGADRIIETAKERWKDHPDELNMAGAAHLMHTILDVVVDEYQLHADAIETEMEDIEDIALATLNTPHIHIQRQLYSVKQRISRLRRYALPVERMIQHLLAMEQMDGLMPDETKNLFRDVQDHLLRISAQLHNAGELSQGVLDLVRGEQAERLSVQGRKLSAWAAIFAVGTLIAGIYGMNFELIPDESSLTGFWFAIFAMVASSGALYAYFKKRGWL